MVCWPNLIRDAAHHPQLITNWKQKGGRDKIHKAIVHKKTKSRQLVYTSVYQW